MKVQVAGQTLALRTDASPAYLRELAALVDARMATVRAAYRAQSTQAQALLCALLLADELRQTESRAEGLRREARARTERILAHLHLLDPGADQPEPAPTARRRSRAVTSWR